MPYGMDYGYREFDPVAVRKLRAEITAKLIAKGLTPGHGKWGDVFARHMRKRTY